MHEDGHLHLCRAARAAAAAAASCQLMWHAILAKSLPFVVAIVAVVQTHNTEVLKTFPCQVLAI